jgi:segregation and condensation protein A
MKDDTRRELDAATALTAARAAADENGEGDGARESAGALVVHLERFAGPLDLLLHLIKRDEIDIYDIPIKHITEQYLRYIDLMRSLDLEVAGEYLVMAATLVRIKARLLLPSPPEEEELDPRDHLVQRLLEYRQFKEAAEALRAQETERRNLVARGYIPVPDGEAQVDLLPVNLFKLLDVLSDVLSRRREEFFHRVETERVSVEDAMRRVIDTVAGAGRTLFRELLEPCADRVEMVTVIMGLLELMRLAEVYVVQDALFGDIWVFSPSAAKSELGVELTRPLDVPVEADVTGDANATGD